MEASQLRIEFKTGEDNVKQAMDTVKGMGYEIGLLSNKGKLQVLDFNVTFQ